MTATFSAKLGFLAMLTTLIFVGATLIYLTICQQSMIKTMQRNLYQFCLKSLVGQLDESSPQGKGSGVENEH